MKNQNEIETKSFAALIELYQEMEEAYNYAKAEEEKSRDLYEYEKWKNREVDVATFWCMVAVKIKEIWENSDG